MANPNNEIDWTQANCQLDMNCIERAIVNENKVNDDGSVYFLNGMVVALVVGALILIFNELKGHDVILPIMTMGLMSLFLLSFINDDMWKYKFKDEEFQNLIVNDKTLLKLKRELSRESLDELQAIKKDSPDNCIRIKSLYSLIKRLDEKKTVVINKASANAQEAILNS